MQSVSLPRKNTVRKVNITGKILQVENVRGIPLITRCVDTQLRGNIFLRVYQGSREQTPVLFYYIC